MNSKIAERDNSIHQTSLEAILSEPDWINGLYKYTGLDKNTYMRDNPLFRRVPVSTWVHLLLDSDPFELNQFRHWFAAAYPSNVIRQNMYEETKLLQGISDALNPDSVDDLIKAQNLRWIQGDFKRIIDLHKRSDN